MVINRRRQKGGNWGASMGAGIEILCYNAPYQEIQLIALPSIASYANCAIK